MGDFSDLRELIEYCAAAGMDLVGLNPLHAPQMGGADLASPYSPSDRRFLNPLYIDPQRVQDFSESELIREQFNSPSNQQTLTRLRKSPLVDYDGVSAFKYSFFSSLFQHFCQAHLLLNSDRAQAFYSFVRRQGEPLQAFSQHESEHCALPVTHVKDPIFHQYLQWITAAQRSCRSAKTWHCPVA